MTVEQRTEAPPLAAPPAARRAERPERDPWAGALGRVLREGRPFLRARRGVVVRLAGWSALEFGQTFLGGYGVARALDDGFLAGRPGVGLLWLLVAVAATLPAGAATRGVFGRLADLVEPFRDGLVRRAVARALGDALEGPGEASSGAVSRVTHQSEIARDGWAGTVLALRSFVFTTAGALAGMAALEPRLLLVVLPPVAVGVALFAATLGPMAARQHAYLTADEAYAGYVGQTASALRDIAATGARDEVSAIARDLTLRQARAARQLARWSAVRIGATALCGRVPPVVLLFAAPWLLDHGLTGGALVGALTYLTQALAPAVHALMSVLGTAGGRLVVVLDRFTDPVPPPRPDPVPVARAVPRPSGGGAPRHEAELRGVTFAYGPGARPVVDRLDLRVRRGERVAVVGPSGAGKSTLAGLLAAVVAPDEGQVLWSGRPAASVEAASVRTLLPQRAFVFSASLRDNLRYLRPGATDREIAETVGALGLGALVDRVGGLDAPVAPGHLSRGERQLVALGRAHLSTAPLVLLDEATSGLDPVTEARVEDALADRARTLVVIAHRPGSARRADRVVVMDGTHVVCGTPAELPALSPFYRELTGVPGRWPGTGDR
ncbi:ATP-binding cassette domain-containing protein [Streptomyces halstedii]|uniref:ATP-binding cassette domain-containing protein n=1 Tax=Streptomyces halstedii TaxID=1944 RepID=UPI0036D1B9D4